MGLPFFLCDLMIKRRCRRLVYFGCMNEVLGIIDGVARFAALLGGALAAVFFCWSGFLWMTAMGDPQKMAQARGSLIGAAIGLIIVGVSFAAPRAISEMVIEPAGGIAIGTIRGTNCDGVLRQQMVVQRSADRAEEFNFLVKHIQAQRDECRVGIWSPVVHSGTSTCAVSGEIGGMQVPRGLMTSGGGGSVRNKSGRDARNNILVYWSIPADGTPSDGSSCWLYRSDFNAWSEGY